MYYAYYINYSFKGAVNNLPVWLTTSQLFVLTFCYLLKGGLSFYVSLCCLGKNQRRNQYNSNQDFIAMIGLSYKNIFKKIMPLKIFNAIDYQN